jgi:uncharacterized protein (DUF2252 family)
LALSLSSDARGSSLSGSMTARILETIVDAYALAFSRARKKRDARDDEAPKAVMHALRASRTRGWKALADERIDGPSPQIPLGAKFWPLTEKERSALEDFIHSPAAHKLITGLSHRPDDAEVRFVDAAYWVKGCSSLGLSRFAALASVEAKRHDREYCLIDLKEARDSIAPCAPGASTPGDNALRVITGAAQLAPNLGERMTAMTMLGKAFYARELMPADLKLEIEALSEDEALLSARYLARVVGVAHRHQMKPDERAAWKRELDGRRSKSLDAPSWLWRSVVDLLARHERAYLEHCRRVIASA